METDVWMHAGGHFIRAGIQGGRRVSSWYLVHPFTCFLLLMYAFTWKSSMRALVASTISSSAESGMNFLKRKRGSRSSFDLRRFDGVRVWGPWNDIGAGADGSSPGANHCRPKLPCTSSQLWSSAESYPPSIDSYP
eukprot:scaffold1744_cov340-Prasinococcus_capsulatus_cf.AAC.20